MTNTCLNNVKICGTKASWLAFQVFLSMQKSPADKAGVAVVLPMGWYLVQWQIDPEVLKD